MANFLTWKDVFDSQKVFPKMFSSCAEIAKSVGYNYFAFNGRVHHVKAIGPSDYVCIVEELEGRGVMV